MMRCLTVRGAALVVPVACAATPLLVVGCGESDAPTERVADPAGASPLVAAPSSRASRAGRRACASKSPAALEAAFLRRARHAASPEERLFLSDLVRNRAELRRPDTYPQVLSGLYAMTSLPRAQRRDGYLGCAHELQKTSSKPAPASGGRS